jgi:hypothetical protein
MHPEILRQIASHQIADRHARAHRDGLAKTFIQALRRGRPVATGGFVGPAIPDYVDGSFRVAEAEAGQVVCVPAARTGA